MGSSAGRRSAVYVRTRTLFQAGATCWMCGTYGRMTVDHDPPLSTAPHPDLWRGVYRPACQPCQSRQGVAVREAKRQAPTWTF